jgi:hypothetical protein
MDDVKLMENAMKPAVVLIEESGAQAIIHLYEGGEAALIGRNIICDSRKDKWCSPKEEDLGFISVDRTAEPKLVVDEKKKAEALAECDRKEKEKMAQENKCSELIKRLYSRKLSQEDRDDLLEMLFKRI